MKFEKTEIGDGFKCILIDDNGEICSSLNIGKDYHYYSRGSAAYLYNFSTKNGKRNKGYGRRLLIHVISFLKDKCDAICLHACPCYIDDTCLAKQELLGFYKSCGFQIHGDKNELATLMILEFCNKK